MTSFYHVRSSDGCFTLSLHNLTLGCIAKGLEMLIGGQCYDPLFGTALFGHVR